MEEMELARSAPARIAVSFAVVTAASGDRKAPVPRFQKKHAVPAKVPESRYAVSATTVLVRNAGAKAKRIALIVTELLCVQGATVIRPPAITASALHAIVPESANTVQMEKKIATTA